MEIDMHYYCILALARATGYPKEEAHIIAYASQYVDDATESEPIQLIDDFPYDPVRTAHIGLECFDTDVQKKIYFPFHFIPPAPRRDSGFSFFTEPDSKLANQLLDEVDKDTSEIRLHRMGTALHAYADTWSHQQFSGRNCTEENDVENIRIKQDGKTYHPWKDNIVWDFLPEIGHAEAGHYPDRTHLNWLYDAPGRKRKNIKRNNPADFLTAARSIHDRLVQFRGASDKVWASVEPEVRRLLDQRSGIEEKCISWQQSSLLRDFFGSKKEAGKYAYRKTLWRQEALKPLKRQDRKNLNWDRIDRAKFTDLQFSARGDIFKTNFAKFHRAAHLQRSFVVSQLM